jgi:hypothetical protein
MFPFVLTSAHASAFSFWGQHQIDAPYWVVSLNSICQLLLKFSGFLHPSSEWWCYIYDRCIVYIWLLCIVAILLHIWFSSDSLLKISLKSSVVSSQQWCFPHHLNTTVKRCTQITMSINCTHFMTVGAPSCCCKGWLLQGRHLRLQVDLLTVLFSGVYSLYTVGKIFASEYLFDKYNWTPEFESHVRLISETYS